MKQRTARKLLVVGLVAIVAGFVLASFGGILETLGGLAAGAGAMCVVVATVYYVWNPVRRGT